jgi:hypothetical protein
MAGQLSEILLDDLLSAGSGYRWKPTIWDIDVPQLIRTGHPWVAARDINSAM